MMDKHFFGFIWIIFMHFHFKFFVSFFFALLGGKKLNDLLEIGFFR